MGDTHRRAPFLERHMKLALPIQINKRAGAASIAPVSVPLVQTTSISSPVAVATTSTPVVVTTPLAAATTSSTTSTTQAELTSVTTTSTTPLVVATTSSSTPVVLTTVRPFLSNPQENSHALFPNSHLTSLSAISSQSSTTPIAAATTSSSSTLLATSSILKTSSTAPVSTAARVTSVATTGGITTTLVVTGTASHSSSSSSSSSASTLSQSNDSSSSGPSAGTVVGIVAGVLVGVIVLATFCGWLFRKKWGRRDEDEDSPFDRDDFRRQSVMLEDDQHTIGPGGGYSGGHSPQMSEHSMSQSASYANLGRNNTVLPGLSRGGTMASPRPPSSIVNHFQRQQVQQQMMPSFSPGQVIPNAYGQQQQGPAAPQPVFNGAPYSNNPGGMELYGGYPVAVPQQHQLDRGIYGMPPQQQYGYAPQQHSPPQQQYHSLTPGPPNLSRAVSNASAYSSASAPSAQAAAGSISRGRSPGPNSPERPLSLVHEEEERGDAYSRSGTPVDSNVQQSYFAHHQHSDSNGSAGRSLSPMMRAMSPSGTMLPGYDAFDGRNGGAGAERMGEVTQNPFARQRSLTGMTGEERREERAGRTLSVRNADGEFGAVGGGRGGERRGRTRLRRPSRVPRSERFVRNSFRDLRILRRYGCRLHDSSYPFFVDPTNTHQTSALLIAQKGEKIREKNAQYDLSLPSSQAPPNKPPTICGIYPSSLE
ncbi:hypothetical protein P7C70_g8715, partial [Phenoliferia sp. Uapishka_3]